jgi:hypothetical protein
MTEEIKREVLVKFVDTLLKNKQLEAVSLNIDFKDGSKINIHKTIWDNKGEEDY